MILSVNLTTHLMPSQGFLREPRHFTRMAFCGHLFLIVTMLTVRCENFPERGGGLKTEGFCLIVTFPLKARGLIY